MQAFAEARTWPKPGTSDGQARRHRGVARHRVGRIVGAQTALERRLAELTPLADPVILRDIAVGMKTQRQTVRMSFDQNMGELYPFSLREKLKVITEKFAVL